MLRNRIYFLSLFALTACAPMSVQQSAGKADTNKIIAATGQAAASQTEQQSSSSLPADNSTEVHWPEILPGQTAANNTGLTILSPASLVKTECDIVTAKAEFISATVTTPAIPATPKTDIWQRIRNGYAMPDQDSKVISRYEHWYASRPEYVDRMTERGKRYLYFIVEEVEKRGMPTEIALLPMIESAFYPGAYSTAKASGIWQFIPSTGKNFGMKQNWWYDGRRDVINATNGALDYLQQLHDQFGEWDLALAAYNCGENAVMRAQARNRKHHLPTNYASLNLPKETRGYVPKLMAIKNIISHPENFDLQLTAIPNKPYFAEVNTSRHIDVELAAEMAGISMEEFQALNPAHNRPVILKKDNEVLLLPVDSVETFRANLEQASEPLVSWQACPTKKGENLDTLAFRYGISSEKLRSVNGIHRSAKVSNGQTLLVPLNGEEAEIEFAAFNTNLPPTDNRLLNAVKHTVRRGDTLSGIARHYHVRLSSLKSWNRGVRILRPGQHILVAQPTQIQRASKSNRNIRRVSSTRKIKHTKSEKM